MKNQLLAIMLIVTALTSVAQDNSAPTKIYYNEFGIDATGFLKQYLNFGYQQYPTNYVPTYYLTYRRHFKCGNIRAAIGGDFTNQDIPPVFVGDSNKYYNNSSSIDASIGWEFVNDLSKHWQIYYGLDFRLSYSHSKDDATYWNGGYANGEEDKTQINGIAPFLGFRFRLTNRLSLTTEASFSINSENSSSRQYFTPVTSQYPPMPDVVSPNVKKTYSDFSEPLSVIITFDI